MLSYKFYPNPQNFTPSGMVWMVTFSKSDINCEQPLKEDYFRTKTLQTKSSPKIQLICLSFGYTFVGRKKNFYSADSIDRSESSLLIQFYFLSFLKIIFCTFFQKIIQCLRLLFVHSIHFLPLPFFYQKKYPLFCKSYFLPFLSSGFVHFVKLLCSALRLKKKNLWTLFSKYLNYHGGSVTTGLSQM